MLKKINDFKARKRNITFFVHVLFTGLTILLLAAAAQAQTVLNNDFEDGSLQNWIPRGGTVVLTNTTEAAASGSRSLKTTGRTAGFNGPSLNALGLLTRGTIYQVTASVRLVGGEAATALKITMQRTPTGGSTAFDQVTPSTNATDGGWVTLSGQYSFTTDVSSLLLYVEAASATASFYVDDFSIRVVPALGCADPPDTSGIHTNFETGTREGWTPRIGRETLAVTNADAHDSTYSLLTTGRQAAFDGPAINPAGKLCNGSRYNISLWVKLAPGAPNTQLRVSIQRTLGGVTNFNTVIGNTTVTANGWTRLRTTYDFGFNYNSLTLYVESNSGTPSFYIDDFDLTYVPPPTAEPNIPSVYQTLAPYFPVGAAVWSGDLTGEHAVLLKKHFNSITSENDMKWSALQPTEGNFTFAAADAQVSFAGANNMQVRGHTLVWHQQNPAYLFNDANGNPMTPTEANKTLLLQRLENHIRAVMTHFGSDVYAWDVVNEVIDPSQPDGFRRSPWFNITGTEYIERAFRVAREVAPNAKLYINDFDTTNPTKRQFLYNLIIDLKNNGVPIDGIGHQMHNNVDFPSKQAIIDTVNLFASLGVDNQITELDVSIYSGANPTIYDDYSLIPQSLFIKQGYKYRDIFDAFRQLQGKISSVTFWGQADDHTWLTSSGRVNAPLLFDTSLKHKYAYLGVIDPLKLPGADIVTTLSAAPNPVLSGGGVAYTITVTNDGQSSAPDDLPAANVTLTDVLPAGTTFQALNAPAGWNCTIPNVGAGGQIQCSVGALAAGASAQFVLTLNVDCPTPDGAQIVNSASAASTTADPNSVPNNTASASVTVSNPAPVLTNLSVSQPVLNVPNHKMVQVAVNYDVADNCGTVSTSLAVTSNEPPDEFESDWEIVDAHTVRLRAERLGTGSGRIYTLTVTAVDSAGNVATETVTVSVPRGLGN
jgi:endo-1,4-beta-xylanase